MENWLQINDVGLLKEGDLIRGITSTFSQKWLSKSGYQHCNCTNIGLVKSSNHTNIYDVKCNIIFSDIDIDIGFVEDVYIVADIGTSGMSYIEKYIGNQKEQLTRNYTS